MNFHRIVESDCIGNEDCPDYWVCENCLLEEFIKCFTIINENTDPYYEMVCDECGAHYDFEWGCYINGRGDKIEENEE